MKKLTTLLALSCMLLLGACSGNKTKCDVVVTGSDGATVTLVDMLSGETLQSLSSKAGKLSLTAKADRGALLSVRNDENHSQFLFFNDGTPVAIDMSNGALTGSETNNKINYYNSLLGAIMRGYQTTSKEFAALSPEEQKAGAQAYEEKAAAIWDTYDDMLKSVLKENPDNLIPAAFANVIARTMEDDEVEAFFNADAPYAKHPYTLSVKKKIDDLNARLAAAEAAKQESIGKPFTDLEEPDTEGNMHKLSEYIGKGQWVFVDFWASWCGPCRAEMPNVVAAYEKYHPKGLEIVGLSFDKEKDAWVKAIEDLKMPWIHLSDLKGWETVASDTYDIKSIPASLLVDPEGVIVARDLRGDALGSKLAEIFGE